MFIFTAAPLLSAATAAAVLLFPKHCARISSGLFYGKRKYNA